MPDDRGGQTAKESPGRAILWLCGFVFLLGLSMFLAAGQFRWKQGWIFLVIYTVATIAAVVYLWRTNPEVVVARSTLRLKGQPAAQSAILPLLLVSYVAMFPVAAMDAARFHWSRVPLWLTVIGYFLFLVGMAANVWVLRVNKFAEASVRIQTERSQKVVDTGPYAVMRHPLYATAFFMFVGIPLALGSFWALVPAVIGAGVILLRTELEDRMLHNELAGYNEYARRVRYRLIPGLW